MTERLNLSPACRHRRQGFPETLERGGNLVVFGREREPQEALGNLAKVAAWPEGDMGALEDVERDRQRVGTEVVLRPRVFLDT